MYEPTWWEQQEIERLSKKEPGEPAFVTKEKERMVKLIKTGRSDEIDFDEWGEVSYPIDPNTDD